MAFIKLNGWTIPIIKGGESKPVVVGKKVRGYDGSPSVTRRGWKRQSRFGTTPLGPLAAEGLLGMIIGRGHHWQCNTPWASDDTAVGTDFYDTRGLAPTGGVSATVVPGYDLQSPAKRIYEESSGEPESKFGGGALKVEPNTTNELPADSRDAENAPTGYTLFNGSTITGETTIRAQGTKSLKITTGGAANSGAYTANATGLTGGNVYTGSVYIYTTEALAITVQLFDPAGNDSNAYTSTPNVWERVEVTRTLDPGETTAGILVFHPPAAAGKVIYCDMFQIEETDYATAWADGARAAGALRYNLDPVPRALAVSMWAKGPSANPTGVGYLWKLQGSSVSSGWPYLHCLRSAATNNVQFAIHDGSVSKTLSHGTPWDGDWHHVCCVYAPNIDGDGWAGLYFDGTLVDSLAAFSGTGFPDLRGFTVNRFNPGSNSGADWWIGALDDIMVFPFPVSGDVAAALASRTVAVPAYPGLDVTGDVGALLDTRGIEAQGLDDAQAGYDPVVDSGTHKAYMRRVSFGLHTKEDF